MKLIKQGLLGLIAISIIAVAAPAQAAQYWVDTFANAPGYSSPGATQTGTLFAGTSYVYCKVWGPQVGSGGAYNHWWLQTDLDAGSPWQNQYVSAYYLSRWGNDEAKDNGGTVIPDCGGGGGAPTYVTATYTFDDQDDPNWCGPASTKLALSAAGVSVSQATLASPTYLNTANLGQTPHINNVRDVLNTIGTGFTYATRSFNFPYTSSEKEDLRSRIITTIGTRHRVIVANVLGSGVDLNGTSHSYSGGHYLTIVGYKASDNAETVVIDDVAISNSGTHLYYMDLDELTTWIANKGYAYAP